MNKKVLVIGYGSIGKRHENILSNLGYEVIVVSRRINNRDNFYQTIEEALKNNAINYVVISNETQNHQKTLDILQELNYSGKILLEKPANIMRSESKNEIFVGYNLRFHPVIKALKKELINEEVYAVNCYVGQYLPTWRPNTDYRNCYSASEKKGGGVLKDLSHELDYLNYLFGKWEKLVSSGGKISNLEIDSLDEMMTLYATKTVPNISLEMNYLDRIIQRYIIVHTGTKTIRADLINNTLQINNKIKHFDLERNDTYRDQHLAILNEVNTEQLASLQQGIYIDDMIVAVEKSVKESRWIYNE